MKNYGIECARITAIFLVILQHIFSMGGIPNGELDTLQKLQARFLEAGGQCCVNIFAIITGYICLHKTDWKWGRLAALWVQVFVTGLFMVSVSHFILGATVTSHDWLTALLPITMDEYWYFTGYVIVFVLTPFINKWLQAAYTRFPKVTVTSVIGIFVIIGLITVWPGKVTLLPLNKGYSGAWLVLLYILGATIRLIDDKLPKTSLPYFAIAFLAIIVTVSQRLAISSFDAFWKFFNDEWTLVYYTSPSIVIMAVSFFLAFSRLHIHSPHAQKILSILGGASFGCYIIHVQPVFFDLCIKGHFAALGKIPSVLFGIGVLTVVALMYLLLTAVDLLRQYLTDKVYSAIQAHIRK